MPWWFKKKKEEEEDAAPKRRKEFVIPREHLPEIIWLYDDNKREKTRMTKYRLWNRIWELFPEVVEEYEGGGEGVWTIEFVNATQVLLYYEEN